MPSIWDELTIAATKDTKAIRRAYAERLRTIDPDRDPVAFQKLRAAYEQALRYSTLVPRKRVLAETEPLAEEPHEGATQAEPPPTPLEPPSPTPEEIERTQAQRDVSAALHEGDSKKALTLLVSALARGVVNINARESALEAVMPAVVQDKTLSADEYVALLNQTGWSVIPTARERVSRTRKAAMARGEAESWFLDLRSAASEPEKRVFRLSDPIKSTRAWLKRRCEQKIAQAFLNGTWFPRISVQRSAGLKNAMERLTYYEQWIGHRFCPENIKYVEAMVRDEAGWRAARKFVRAIFWMLAGCTLIAIGIASGIGHILVPLVILGRWVYPAVRRGFANNWR